MNDAMKGTLIAEYHTVKLRTLFLFITIGIVAFLVFRAIDPYLTDKTHHKYFFVACFMAAFLPLSFWGTYLRRTFKLTAYSNGIDVWDLGYYSWDDIILQHQEKMLVVAIPFKSEMAEHKKTNKFDQVDVFHARFEDAPSLMGHYVLRIRIPTFLTNMSRQEFVRTISTKKLARQPSVIRKEPVIPDISKEQWKTAMFGENTTPAKMALTTVILVLSISGIYILLAGDFITFKSSLFPAVKAVCIATGCVLTFFTIKNRHKNPKLAGASRFKLFSYSLLGLCLYPFLIYVLLIMPTFVAFHYLTGRDYVSAVYYVEKTSFDNEKSCGYTHALETETFDMPLLKEICLSDEFYDLMPEAGILAFKGKESAIGRSVAKVALPPDSGNPERLRAYKAEIDESWAEYR